MRRLATLLTLALLLMAARNGAAAGDFAFGVATWQAADIVEQQSPAYFESNHDAAACLATGVDTCVHNPTHATSAPCPWTEDDEWQNGAYGTLSSGTVSTDGCLFADNTNLMPLTHITGTHLIGVRVVADTGRLVVSLSFRPFGVSFSFTPRPVAGRYEYRGCVVGPIPDSVQSITGSNGGWAVSTQFTFSVGNPTGKRQGKVLAQVILWDNAPGLLNSNLCQPLGQWFDRGGAGWQVGL